MTIINTECRRRDVVVVGASAGGVVALQRLMAGLPADFGGVVAIVLHRSPFFEGALPRVLGNGTRHTIVEPNDGEPVRSGGIYVAPRDRHMMFDDGRLRLNRSPKQHHTRPAVDPLFESAARAYGVRVVGVVLSGGGDDGVHGLIAIKAAGGMSLAQDPDEAAQPYMPMNAILYDRVDAVLPLADIALALSALAAGKPVATNGTPRTAEPSVRGGSGSAAKRTKER